MGADTLRITAEELLAGSDVTFDVAIPDAFLHPSLDAAPGRPPGGNGHAPRSVRIRPLTVRDVQLIARAARGDEILTSVLMLQRAIVEPPLRDQDVAAMPSGLVRFLLDRVNRASGLTTTEDDVADVVSSPLVQSFFVLAKEFGWTPEQVRSLTVAQVLSYLELLNHDAKGRNAAGSGGRA